MKQILILLLTLGFTCGTFASSPKACKGNEKEIHKMLLLLAESAEPYYKANGQLPETWSSEMASIIDSIPNSNMFGNITSVDREQKIRITCSEKTAEGKYIHYHYDIHMNSLAITHSLDRQVKVRSANNYK